MSTSDTERVLAAAAHAEWQWRAWEDACRGEPFDCSEWVAGEYANLEEAMRALETLLAGMGLRRAGTAGGAGAMSTSEGERVLAALCAQAPRWRAIEAAAAWLMAAWDGGEDWDSATVAARMDDLRVALWGAGLAEGDPEQQEEQHARAAPPSQKERRSRIEQAAQVVLSAWYGYVATLAAAGRLADGPMEAWRDLEAQLVALEQALGTQAALGETRSEQEEEQQHG